MTETHCAVVVTFNRKDYLLRCLHGLRSQTVPLDAIFLIDNASTDGTTDLLIKQEILPVGFDPKAGPYQGHWRDLAFHYERLSSNAGGAGGFYHAIRTAYKQGYDWLWLMDDDVEPTPDGLEKMISYKQISKCIHPSKILPDGTRFLWEGWLNSNTGFCRWKHDKSFDRGDDYVEVNYGCFEGMLLHRQIVERIGLPDRRFFMCGDDLVYGWLASKHTTVIYVRDVAFQKNIVTWERKRLLGVESYRFSDLTVYLDMRNHFLIIEYLSRNARSYALLYALSFAKFLKKLFEILLYDRSSRRVRLLCRGLNDGITKNFKGHRRFIQ